MRKQNKTVVVFKHWLFTLTLAVSFASGSVYADNWEQLKASGDPLKLQEYIRQNPASDHLAEAASLAFEQITRKGDDKAVYIFLREFRDFMILPDFQKRGGLDTRYTFREGKIGERYVPTLSHSTSSTNTRYINGRAINETTYSDYTTGGYNQDRHGFTAVYQLFNDSDNNYIVRLNISGTVTMTELKGQAGGIWNEAHHTTQTQQTKLEQQTSYLLRKGENIRDQLLVGEKQPTDFKVAITEITPVSDSWINGLQRILDGDVTPKPEAAATLEVENNTGIWHKVKAFFSSLWQAIVAFWGSATELPSMLAPKADPLTEIEYYLQDPRASMWSERLKQRYTEEVLKKLDILVEPEPRYDRDFDSQVTVFITNNASTDFSIEYTTNFGAKGRATLQQGQRNELPLRGKGVNKDSLSFTITNAVNTVPAKTDGHGAAVTPAQLQEFRQRIDQRAEEAAYKHANNLQTLRAFVATYPKSSHITAAHDRIERISFSSTDLTVMYRYLMDYPKSVRLGEMQAKINVLLKPQGFLDNFDGTVTQLSTHLQWMRCSVGQNWTGQSCSGKADIHRLNEAKALKMSFAGHTDWRLPDVRELASLVDCSPGDAGSSLNLRDGKPDVKHNCSGKYQVPTINQLIFPDTPKSWFWSSTLNRNNETGNVFFGDKHEMLMGFYSGGTITFNRDGRLLVRLVRDTEAKRKTDAQAANLAAEQKKMADEKARLAAEEKKKADEKARLAAEEKRKKELLAVGFIDNGDGTVTAINTKLVWQRCSIGQSWTGSSCSGRAQSFTWDDAMNQAKDGWRLPTLDELDTLVICSSGQRDPSTRPSGRYVAGVMGECRDNFTRPTINQLAFPNTPSSLYWSSLPNTRYSARAWHVGFHNGVVRDNLKSSGGSVRLIRTANSKDIDISNTSQPTTSNTSPKTAATEPALPFSAGQTWVGNYRCAQGSTPLRLIISSVNGTEVNAKFDFTSRGVNGIYELNGVYNNSSRKITFATGNWVKRASGFGMVGMDGTVSKDGKTFSGDITDRGCSTFQVNLQ